MCSLLNSHPDVLCRREDFDLVRVEDFEADETSFQFKHKLYHRQIKSFGNGVVDNPTPQQSVEHLRKIMSQKRTACGFKFKFDIQIASFPEIVDELHWLNRHLRVILLTRENFLKQAVSRQNMERLQFTMNSANLGKNRRRLPPIKLDCARAVHYATRFKASNERFNNSAARFENVKTVVYENLLSNPLGEIKDILGFLGVDSEQNLSAKLHKATPNCLADAVENYDELVTAVSGTELEAYLD